MRYDKPFDISIDARMLGRTQHDGEIFISTGGIIFDGVKGLLEQMKKKGQIKEYSITVKDNLADAEKTIKRNK